MQTTQIKKWRGKMRSIGNKGFTLLELLVVITLLAILSLGALSAYEGLTDTAQTTAKANNSTTIDRAIRAYAVIEQNYPNHWDHLVTNTGASLTIAADITYEHLANVNIVAPLFRSNFDEMFENVGMDTFKVRQIVGFTPDVVPNLQHNFGSAGADVSATAISSLSDFAIVPDATSGGTACSVAGVPVNNKLNGVLVSADDANHLNAINDSLDTENCELIVAFGFGHDAAHSTAQSKAAIATAPTHVTKDVNPAKNYARFLGLFKVGEDQNGDDNIDETELYKKPRLISMVCAEGHPLDEEIGEAFEKDQ
ncbi:MAG TPA: type II secretion system protein [Methylotenera sp.]|nr:type II secretion system protein [Methylotenera sp.]